MPVRPKWRGDDEQARAWLTYFLETKPKRHYGYLRNILANGPHLNMQARAEAAATMREKHSEKYFLWFATRRVMGKSVPNDGRENTNAIER